MKKKYLTELEALRIENEQLAEWHRDLQEKFLAQGKLLAKAVKFIERQSGGLHYENLIFLRDEWISNGTFAIRNDGTIRQNQTSGTFQNAILKEDNLHG